MARPKKDAVVQVENTMANFELSAEIVAGKLTSNAIELKTQIENELQKYSVEKYLNNPDAAATDKAFLNKVKEAVSDKRKEVTKKWNEPLDEFLMQMKSLEKSITDASNKLKTITDEVDAQEKAKKRKEIEDYWSTLGCTLIDLNKIFNPKWLNKTFKMKDVMLECESAIEKITSELETINKTAEENDRDLAKAFYLETLDLNRTLLKLQELKENRAKIKAEEEKKAAESVVKENLTTEKVVGVDMGKNPDVSTVREPVLNFNLAVDFNEVWALAKFCEDQKIECKTTLMVQGTKSELLLLRKLIDSKGIDYIKL